MNVYSREELREIIAQLVEQGYLDCGSGEILEPTPTAAEILFRRRAVACTMEAKEA